MKKMHAVFGLAAFAGFTTYTAADYDVSPKVSGGQIVVNAFFDAEEFEVENVAVFGYSFGEDILLPPNELADPGFHPLPGSGFAGSSLIGINGQSVLQYWNGTGSPAFAPASAGTSMTYAFGPTGTPNAANVTGTSAGALVNVGPVDASGEFDDHLDTEITLAAPAGIYLFSANLSTNSPGVSPSRDIYFLFNYGSDEDTLDAAVEFARDTFAPGTTIPVVPEPATMGLLAATALMRRRQRKGS